MTTHSEQLRQIAAFRALTLFEQDVAQAIKPFQAQQSTLGRDRGDFTPRAYAQREQQIRERITTAVNEATAAWDNKKEEFLKIAGRDTPGRYPVKDTNRAVVLLTQLGVDVPSLGPKARIWFQGDMRRLTNNWVCAHAWGLTPSSTES